MANSLLDFVISLVRDPEAAARYAANPAQAIADAHLTDVTSIDVNNLIPMVSDSLSMAGPAAAVSGMPVADHGNVWASGAATAAFDAFTPQTPPAAVPQHNAIGGVINEPTAAVLGDVHASPAPVQTGHYEPSPPLAGGGVPEMAFDQGSFPAHDPGLWDHAAMHSDADPQDGPPDHHGLGIHGLHG